MTDSLQHPVLPVHQDRQPCRKEEQAAHSVAQVRDFKYMKYAGMRVCSLGYEKEQLTKVNQVFIKTGSCVAHETVICEV